MSQDHAPIVPTSQVQSDSDRFRSAVEELAEIALSEGVFLEPYLNPNLEIFSALTVDAQRATARDAEEMANLWITAKEEDGQISNTKRLLWRFFSTMKLHAPADFFDRLKDGWAVEVYSRDSLQIFRNFEVFRLTSFSLEQLLAMPWWKRYQREEGDNDFLKDIQQGIFEGRIRECVTLPSRPHSIREIGSSEELGLSFDAKIMAPVFHGDQVFGFVCCSAASRSGKEA